MLISEVTRLYGNKRIWITEYGYQTNPPDRIFGVSFANQARYLTQAYGIAKRNPRIDMFLWFLLRDERRGVDQGWQSGLLTATGREEARLRGVPEAPRLAGRDECVRDEVEAFLEPDPRLVAEHSPRCATSAHESRTSPVRSGRYSFSTGLPSAAPIASASSLTLAWRPVAMLSTRPAASGASPASRFASTTLAT